MPQSAAVTLTNRIDVRGRSISLDQTLRLPEMFLFEADRMSPVVHPRVTPFGEPVEPATPYSPPEGLGAFSDRLRGSIPTL